MDDVQAPTAPFRDWRSARARPKPHAVALTVGPPDPSAAAALPRHGGDGEVRQRHQHRDPAWDRTAAAHDPFAGYGDRDRGRSHRGALVRPEGRRPSSGSGAPAASPCGRANRSRGPERVPARELDSFLPVALCYRGAGLEAARLGAALDRSRVSKRRRPRDGTLLVPAGPRTPGPDWAHAGVARGGPHSGSRSPAHAQDGCRLGAVTALPAPPVSARPATSGRPECGPHTTGDRRWDSPARPGA